MTLAEIHERLLAWATAEPRKDGLLVARKAHFDRVGEPHEEDRSYEVRQNAMLDFYLYDWRAEGNAATILERFLEAEGASLAPPDLAACRDLGRNVHTLFEVRRVKDGAVRLRDVFTGKDHDVTERRHVAGLSKGDLIEARLLPYDGKLFFSGAFLYHPPEARKAVLVEVKRLKKEAGRGRSPDVKGFLAVLSRMAFKLERYRNVRLESIYDFTQDLARTPAPRPERG
jgi:hypothetical protein